MGQIFPENTMFFIKSFVHLITWGCKYRMPMAAELIEECKSHLITTCTMTKCSTVYRLHKHILHFNVDPWLSKLKDCLIYFPEWGRVFQVINCLIKYDSCPTGFLIVNTK